MIQTIYVEPEISLAELKKEFRKKLMTGGAVLRLRPELEVSQLAVIFRNMVADARPNNAAAQVLVQIARHPAVSAELRAELAGAALPEVQSALRAHAGVNG